jgi:hypothetical protein
MTKLYAYAIGALLVVIVLVAGSWYISSLRHDVDQSRSDLAIAQGNVSTCAGALKQADQATSDAIEQAKLYRSYAQSLGEAAMAQKGKNNAAGDAFASKVATSAKAPDCQSVLEAQLCPALSGY